MPTRLILALACLMCSCVTARATRFDTPKERVAECEQICTDVGLRMSALVVIMNASGCVCERPGAPSASREGAAAATGGGAAIIAAAYAAQQQQQQQAAAQ